MNFVPCDLIGLVLDAVYMNAKQVCIHEFVIAPELLLRANIYKVCGICGSHSGNYVE
jgi:hypothetical protein